MWGSILIAVLWLLQSAPSAVAPSSHSAPRKPSAIDRDIPVDEGRRMHIRCTGTGAPTVLLLAGLGDDADSWRTVQPRIAKLTRVCSYDRPGYGTSDASAHRQDVTYTTSQLEILLRTANIGPPYIVVGHSYGGFEAVMFAHRNRGSTGALVLVDSSFPHHDQIFSQAAPSYGQWYRKLMSDRIVISRKCIAAIRSGHNNCWGLSSDERALAYLTSKLSVYENWDASSDQVASVNTLGDLPLFVLTAGAPASMEGKDEKEGPAIAAAWYSMHERYARLSSAGVHRLVPGALHMIQDDRPDVVVATIAEAIWQSANRQDGKAPVPGSDR